MKNTADGYDLLLIAKETRTIYGLNMRPNHDNGYCDAEDIAQEYADRKDCTRTSVDYWDGDIVRTVWNDAYAVPQKEIKSLRDWLENEWMQARDDQTWNYIADSTRGAKTWEEREEAAEALRQEIADTRHYDLEELSADEAIDEETRKKYDAYYGYGKSLYTPGATVNYMRLVLDGEEFYAEEEKNDGSYESLLSSIQAKATEAGRLDAHWIY